MKNMPFSRYDYFGYISVGLVTFFLVDYIFGLGLMAGSDSHLLSAIILIIASYAVGHVIAGFSSALIEQLIVRRCLGIPTRHLLQTEDSGKISKFFFREYTRPFPNHTVKTIRQAFPQQFADADAESLYYEAFRRGRSRETLQVRLESFLNLYGFSRNLTFVLLTMAGLTTAMTVCGNPDISIALPIIFGVGSVLMFYRYLKFFRMYSADLLIEYPSIVGQ